MCLEKRKTCIANPDVYMCSAAGARSQFCFKQQPIEISWIAQVGDGLWEDCSGGCGIKENTEETVSEQTGPWKFLGSH